MNDLHRRLTALAWSERAAIGTAVIDLPFGRAVVTEDLPMVYDQNMLWVSRPALANEVIAAAEGLAADAGWEHRNIEVSDAAVAAELRDSLAAAGYSESRHVTMVLPDSVPLPVPGAAVTVGPAGDHRALGRALLAQEPWVTAAAVLDQFAERERRLATAVQVDAVVAPADRPVSRCLLLSDGTLTEVDAVATLREHRRHGWSSAVMACAISVGRERGAPVVLVADQGDWPLQWYARLGFVAVGTGSQFRRWPNESALGGEGKPTD
jgi:GNAT superfamily N-acetyltransferase